MKINFSRIRQNLPSYYSPLIAVVVAVTVIQYILISPVRPEANKLTYLHYHIINVNIEGPADLFGEDKALFEIYFNGEKVETVAGRDRIELEYNRQKELWQGKFPVPWAAPEGPYRIKYAGEGDINAWEGVFTVHTRRVLEDFPPLKVMTMETTRPLRGFNVPPPGLIEGVGYSGIFEWTKHTGGNTLWYLAAQSSSYSEDDLSYDYPWLKDNLEGLEEFAAGAKESGLDFGAWIVAFRTFGIFSLRPQWYDYSYAYRRSDGTLYETGGISIADRKRTRDIVEMASYLNRLDDIDYVGLDYIRPAPAVAGLELVDDFVQSMDVDLPVEWEDFTKEDRMKWLGEIVSAPESHRDPIKQKWNWWRASRMAMIVKQIKNEAELDKPLWVFMLSWDKGHEHGQDALMFQDAGADLISVMMYEADRTRFNDFVRSWRSYLKDSRANLVVGNQVDWTVHQHSVFPPGPEEFGTRMEKGIKELAGELNLRGAFVNDFSRVLRGRKGPYEKKEWLAAAGRAYSKLNRPRTLELSIEVEEGIISGQEFSGFLRCENLSGSDIENIFIDPWQPEGVEISLSRESIDIIGGGSDEKVSFTGKILGEPSLRMGNYMIAFRIQQENNIYFEYQYFPVSGIALDIGAGLR